MNPTRRHSPKRDAILSVLRETKSHPSAEWIYAQLKPRHPDLSLGTVYRNLNLLADEGADVILGSHSHNIQPIEWLSGRDGGRTLVAYSTGNLISTMLYSYYMVGGLLTFDIVSESGSDPYVDNVVFVPTVTHYSMTRDSLALYRLADYTEALAAAHGAQLNGAFTLATLQGYVKNTIPAEFLP